MPRTSTRPQAMNAQSRQRFDRPAVFLVLCWIGFASSLSASDQTAQAIAKKAFPSTVLLVMQDQSGQTLALGSGFMVRDGEIATNLHVIEGASRGYAKFVGQKTQLTIEGTLAIDPRRDLALLKVAPGRWPLLSLGDSEAVQVGESIYAVGNPQGLEGTFSQGIVSSVRTVGSDRLLQITAPISPGSSGGPVLNQNGQVVGVSVATFRGGQNLNFAIGSNYVRELLSTTPTPRPLSGDKTSAKSQSILSDVGGKATEGVVGGSLLWTNPVCPTCPGDYSFSLRNQLNAAVKNVLCLVVFYDEQGAPLDIGLVRHAGLIPAGLAKRVTSTVDSSVKSLTKPNYTGGPSTKVDFRILDFQIVE